MAKYDAKATSLRRACTALLFFSVLCARPWPSAGWLGLVASASVLCAASNRLLCRARVTRFLSALVAIFAGITFVTLMLSAHADKPQRIGDAFAGHCASMPVDTFQWASRSEFAQKGLAFLSRRMPSISMQRKDASVVAISNTTDVVALSNTTSLASLVGTAAPSWSQPEACDLVSKVATCVAKMMMIGSALAHLFLFLSAAVVVKRACCLRCVAYKSGLLKLNKCGACKCKYTSKPAAAIMPVAKELA